MSTHRRLTSARTRSARNFRVLCATLALTTLCPFLAGGCDSDFDEFRTTVTPGLRTGVNAILDGLVDGVFAVIEPNADSDATTSP